MVEHANRIQLTGVIIASAVNTFRGLVVRTVGPFVFRHPIANYTIIYKVGKEYGNRLFPLRGEMFHNSFTKSDLK